MFGIKSISFTDGTKRINIDYKNIENYNEPFVMTLKVKGKRKLDVWEVANGKEAIEIRQQYKQKGRHTSYKDFYNNIDDLIAEQGEVNFEFHPRIRGKNKKTKEEVELTIDGDKLAENNYLIPKELLDITGLSYEELKILLKKIAMDRLEKIINE